MNRYSSLWIQIGRRRDETWGARFLQGAGSRDWAGREAGEAGRPVGRAWITIARMDLHAFRRLLTPGGQEALEAAAALEPREEDFLAHFTALSRRFAPELARAALETAILRREAAARFPFAEGLYLTREALEQASTWEVARQRAERYRGFEQAADLGCSVGMDSLALAQATEVVGIDLDELRLGMARQNLARANLNSEILWGENMRANEGGDAHNLAGNKANKAMRNNPGGETGEKGERGAGGGEAPPGTEGRAVFVRADLREPLPLRPSPQTALFFDPARRSGSRRVFSVRDYEPPLEILWKWLEDFPALGVKISPGVQLAELESYRQRAGAELEFVSLNGELKEGVLWFGALRSASRRATVLPGGHSLSSNTLESERLPLSEPRAYLYEPDPAVLRAGLVAELGMQLEAAQLDPEIAYLTAEKLQPTPFARAWAVEDWLPFQLKRLRAYLRERGVSRLVVKKRGSPLQPEELIRRLRLPEDPAGEEKVLFLTQLQGRPVVIVAQRAQAEAGRD